MKLQQSGELLVIDNSLVMSVAAGAILCIGGVLLGIWGLSAHVWVVLGLGAALCLGGGLLIAFSKSSHVVLSKSGQSTVSTRTLFTEARQHSFALTEIAKVLLETRERQSTVKDGDGERQETQVTATVFLITQADARVQVGSTTRSVGGGVLGALLRSAPLQREAEQIAAFAGVPLESRDATR